MPVSPTSVRERGSKSHDERCMEGIRKKKGRAIKPSRQIAINKSLNAAPSEGFEWVFDSTDIAQLLWIIRFYLKEVIIACRESQPISARCYIKTGHQNWWPVACSLEHQGVVVSWYVPTSMNGMAPLVTFGRMPFHLVNARYLKYASVRAPDEFKIAWASA